MSFFISGGCSRASLRALFLAALMLFAAAVSRSWGLQVTSIEPGQSYDSYKVVVTTIYGTGFTEGATVELNSVGYATLTPVPGSITVLDGNRIRCAFDLFMKDAGTWWNVTVASATETDTLPFAFVLNPMTVNAVEPASICNTSSVVIATVTGAGFVPGSIITATISGGVETIPVSNIVYLDGERIQFTLTGIFNKTTGTYRVRVSTTNGTETLYRETDLVVSEMGIDRMEPSGWMEPARCWKGETAFISTITGSGFLPGSRVFLIEPGNAWTVEASQVQVNDANSIRAVFDLTGASSSGLCDVKVSTYTVEKRQPNLLYIEPFRVTAVEPAEGPCAHTAFTLTVLGDGFSGTGTEQVYLKNSGTMIAAGSVSSPDSQTLVCTFDLTAGYSSAWDLEISDGVNSTLKKAAFSLTPLSIASVEPATFVKPASSVVCTITGEGFVPDMSVMATITGTANVSASSVQYVDSTTIRVTFSPDAMETGSWSLEISTTGANRVSATSSISVVDGLRVDAMNPAVILKQNAPVTCTVTGAGFVQDMSVTAIQGTAMPVSGYNVTLVNENALQCTFDAGSLQTGPGDIEIGMPWPSVITSSKTGVFSVYEMQVDTVTPGSDYRNNDACTIRVDGSAFYGVTGLKLSRGGTVINASAVTKSGTTRVQGTFDIDNAEAGLWDLIVVTDQGEFTFTNVFEVRECETTVSSPVTPGSVAEVTLHAPSGDVVVQVPANAFLQPVNLTVSVAAEPAAAEENLQRTGVAVTISNNQGLQPDGTITGTIRYRQSDMETAGLDEARLSVCRYDELHQRWIRLAATAEPDANRVTFATDHLSTFGLFQLKPAPRLDNVYPFPNPFHVRYHGLFGRGYLGEGIVFNNLTEMATVKIFNLAGELVAELHADKTGSKVWDVRNQDGKRVASGVYIYLVTDETGSQRSKGKLAIVK